MKQIALSAEQLTAVVNNWADFWNLVPLRAIKGVLNLRGTRDMARYLGTSEDALRYHVAGGSMPGPDIVVGRSRVWGPVQAEKAKAWWATVRDPEGGRHRALTEDESQAVFKRWLAGEKQQDLALEFQVHQSTISRLCQNRRKGRLRRGPVPLL